MYCDQCGSSNRDTAKYCIKCGSKLINNSNDISETVEVMQYQTNYINTASGSNNTYAEKKNSKNDLDVFIWIAGFAFLFIALYSIRSNKNSISPAKARAMQNICFSNQRILQGAVDMYNIFNTTNMTNLDIDLLIKENYLKNKPNKPSSKCSYISTVDVSKPYYSRYIYCPYHGTVTNPTPLEELLK